MQNISGERKLTPVNNITYHQEAVSSLSNPMILFYLVQQIRAAILISESNKASIDLSEQVLEFPDRPGVPDQNTRDITIEKCPHLMTIMTRDVV